MTSDIPQVAALSRPFTLGMLYDARKDQLIPGVTLWDEKTLKEKTKESKQHSSNFEITASDSTEEKSSLLDVNASLKASFMSGLVEVGGSGNYLNDKKKSHKQSRVTLQYKATTVFKQLMMTVDEMKKTLQLKEKDKSLATHVVTGILYGANAFFVFDSEKLDTSNVQEIEGNMQAAINKIPGLSVEGSVDLKLSDEEKAFTNKFTCKFYGDLIPDSNPTTFKSAVQTCRNLPKLLGQNKENSVPLKVWMMPLKYLDEFSAELKTDLSPSLVKRVQDTLEDFHELTIRCDDCLEDGYPFPQIQKRLKDFKELCAETTSKLRKTLSKKLPSIRAGKEDQKEIMKLFDDLEKSPFSTKKLELWMQNMEREVTVIKTCVEMMEGAKVITNEVEFNREVFDPDKEVLCFVFTSLETTDPFLQKMFDNLDSEDFKSTKIDVPSSKDLWYFSEEVIDKMRQKAKMFDDIARVLKKNNSRYRCLVGVSTNEQIKGATIYQYRNGKLLIEDFSKPAVPDVEKITNRGDLIWYAADLTLDPDTAHAQITVCDGNKRATHGDAQQLPDLPQRFDKVYQVLCKEKLSGRHYWEVELNTERGSDVAVGVCYEGIERKGQTAFTLIGWGEKSWSLGYKWEPDLFFYPQHDTKGKEDRQPFPATGCPCLGVYLDHPGGTLSYYIVSGDKLSHIHTFHTSFSEPVLPCFKIWTTISYVFLRL
ncbi:stonustoxin subunit beta-like [Kryptolebias marmoratus]|nr:stonustoxin subunit beta-like [Kryptolebias marmoratus]